MPQVELQLARGGAGRLPGAGRRDRVRRAPSSASTSSSETGEKSRYQGPRREARGGPEAHDLVGLLPEHGHGLLRAHRHGHDDALARHGAAGPARRPGPLRPVARPSSTRSRSGRARPSARAVAVALDPAALELAHLALDDALELPPRRRPGAARSRCRAQRCRPRPPRPPRARDSAARPSLRTVSTSIGASRARAISCATGTPPRGSATTTGRAPASGPSRVASRRPASRRSTKTMCRW